MRILPKSLRSAFATGAIAVVGAVVLIALTVLILIYQGKAYREQKLQEIVAQSDVLAASVTAALVFDDAHAAQEYVSALRAYPDLNVAAVYDAKGRVFASLVRGPGSAVPRHVSARPPYCIDDRVVVIQAIKQNGATVGTIYLQVTIDSALQRFVRYSGIIVLVTMAVLMLFVLGVMQQALTRANMSLREQMAARAKAEEALRQSQKMEALGQLAGGIAHDFNNLLAIIKGSLQLLQKRLGATQPDLQRYMDAAMEGVNRAANVTQRVLAFSRRQTLAQRTVNLSALIANMLDLIRQSAGNSIALETDLRADWPILCDVNQMENVVINLAINARDAMPDGGTLAIKTSNIVLQAPQADVPPGQYVELTMRDTGSGMSQDVLQRAFDPFFTTKPHGKGTGLGLSMALGFVNQSKGFLRIESEVGTGTVVTILMPRVQER